MQEKDGLEGDQGNLERRPARSQVGIPWHRRADARDLSASLEARNSQLQDLPPGDAISNAKQDSS